MVDQPHATGRCLCGAVRFSVGGPLREIVACHCKQCRNQTGSFVMASAASVDDVTIQGEQDITWYCASEDAERGFCSKCGSLMFWRRFDSPYISLMAGSFDEPSVLRTAGHIFCADKGDYYEIDQAVRQFAQGDKGELAIWIEPGVQ
ncbi:MAG: GFA family protein [Pseudomonadota bacterium]